MPKSDFIPTRDADFMLWHDQLKTAAEDIGSTLGISAADLSSLTDDNTALRTRTAAVKAADTAAREAVAARVAARRQAEQRARTLAKRLKLHPAYTPALGARLGIEGTEDTTDLTTAKPRLTVTPMPRGCAEIGFNKLKADGVNIYSQRGAETSFTFLARDTESPYLDNRPLLAPGQPEVRKYKAIYVLGDDEVGLESDVVESVCKA